MCSAMACVNMYSEDCCVICCKKLSASSDAWVTVGTKGLETLVSFSRAAAHTQLEAYLTGCITAVNVHVECRRDYTRKRSYASTADSAGCDALSQGKKLRSSVPLFDWKLCCFLCGEPALPDDRRRERADVHSARTLQLRDNILDICSKRMDAWAVEVQGRLQLCHDFVAAEAVYHHVCDVRFRSGREKVNTEQSASSARNRPKSTVMTSSFLTACEWLESSSDGELFTVGELRDLMVEKFGEDAVYSCKQLKRELQSRYGTHVFFAEVRGRKDVVCFQEMAAFIINDKWYEDRRVNIAEESRRIVAAAALLIRAEIREQKYTTDVYPTSDDIHDRDMQKQWVPPLLSLLMESLMSDEVKQLALSNALVQSVRPRSVISPILFGVGVEMDHAFGSRWLVNELYRLGFSVSYDEVSRYKQSVLQDSKCAEVNVPPYPTCFTQWVADNVDHNSATLDGHGSFHGMGIMAVSTHTGMHTEEVRAKAIARLQRQPAKFIIRDMGIPILLYHGPTVHGLASIEFQSSSSLLYPYTLPPTVNLDLLCSSGWLSADEDKPRSNWSGFMQHVCTGEHPAVSDISFLPIIDLNPSDEACIFSTLSFVQQQAQKLGILTPCITFDQPLWLKAVEVSNAASLDVVCRLGGFHIMMSFLGSIGKVMGGSGLSDVLELCYGPNAVIHMLTGKAVSRALRGYFLIDAALTVSLMKLVLPDSSTDEDMDNSCRLNPADVDSLLAAYDDTWINKCDTANVTVSPALLKLHLCLTILKSTLSDRSRTAKLWVQFLYHMETLKLFIRAERSGDWSLHLIAVTRMLNLFAATGHSQYAKCARLYLQQMRGLQDSHPWLHEQFMSHGFHTVRRSDRYWSGLWTDLAIEQVLMRSLKCNGGLTRGRGVTESVRLMWIYSMHSSAEIHNAMTRLTRLARVSSEQHQEIGTKRAARDHSDLRKIMSWFADNDPFSAVDGQLICLSNGMTATDGDGINCDCAEEVGAAIQNKLDGAKFLDVVLKRRDCVKTLQQLHKGVVVEKKSLFLHTTQLFSRLLALVDRTSDVAPYFKYELTALPASLYKDSRMRKPDKAALGRELTKNAIVEKQALPTAYVLDGGSLLHRVKWPKTGTYHDVVMLYQSYILKHFGPNAVVVFDGYGSGPSTKDHEHCRRSSKAAPTIQVSQDKPICSNQQTFLANSSNKSHFIALLGQHLETAGFAVRYAVDDADTYIVHSALDLAQCQQSVTVVAEDTDILLLLVHHLQAGMAEMFMLSVSKTRKCMPSSYFQ